MALTDSSSNRRRVKRPNGTGSYYESKQKPGVIQAAIKDIHGKLHNKSFRFEPNNRASYSRAEVAAQNWLTEQARARELGQATFVANPKTTVSDFFESWLASRVPPAISDNTYRNYESAIRNWINPYIGQIKLQNVTLNTIENLYNKLLNNGYKVGVTNLVHRILNKAFRDAFRKKLITFNPMVGVEKIKQYSVPTQHIPLKDQKKILEEARKSPYMHARILVGMVLGLRPGEVYGLLWSDIDHEAKTLTIARQVQRVKGKGLIFKEVKQKGIRTIPLPSKVYEALQFLATTQSLNNPEFAPSNALIFPNTVGDKLDARRDGRRWKGLLKKAGVYNYSLYQMRKTAFTNLLSGGVDLKTLQAISGHSQASTLLNSYTFSTTESMKAAVELMDSLAVEK